LANPARPGSSLLSHRATSRPVSMARPAQPGYNWHDSDPAGQLTRVAGSGPAAAGTEDLVSLTDRDSTPVDLSEASRQLELAIHDARVAFDCIALENLDQAHTSVITARAAIDS